MYLNRSTRCADSARATGAGTVGASDSPGQEVAKQAGWVSLFNGKDLSGWKPKITGYDLGDNYADTFRVEGGNLKVSYDKYPQFKVNSVFTG